MKLANSKDNILSSLLSKAVYIRGPSATDVPSGPRLYSALFFTTQNKSTTKRIKLSFIRDWCCHTTLCLHLIYRNSENTLIHWRDLTKRFTISTAAWTASGETPLRRHSMPEEVKADSSENWKNIDNFEKKYFPTKIDFSLNGHRVTYQLKMFFFLFTSAEVSAAKY